MIQTLKDLEDQISKIPEPTYKFQIGDDVCIGNLEDVVVKRNFYY